MKINVRIHKKPHMPTLEKEMYNKIKIDFFPEDKRKHELVATMEFNQIHSI